MNWTGSKKQKSIQEKSIKIIALMIIPVGILLQTIDAWLFSTTYRIGWDSTNMGAYFISGAFVAGVGALVTVVYIISMSTDKSQWNGSIFGIKDESSAIYSMRMLIVRYL